MAESRPRTPKAQQTFPDGVARRTEVKVAASLAQEEEEEEEEQTLSRQDGSARGWTVHVLPVAPPLPHSGSQR